MPESKNEIIVYQPDETIRLEVRLENDTVWLTQEQMCILFQRDQSVITRHIKNVFEEGEVDVPNNMQILHYIRRRRPLPAIKCLGVVSTCLKQELPEPVYDIWADGTIVIVFRKKTVQNSQSDVHQGGTQAALKGKIIQIIRLDDKITIQKMSEMTGVSVRTLKRRINEIPEIRYVGSGYSGHWEIVEDSSTEGNDNGH